MRPILAGLHDAAAYLTRQQLPDGRFVSYTSPLPDDFARAQALPATFATSTILAAVTASSLPELLPLRQRAATFLLAQKSPDWSFNYWTRHSEQAAKQPYPDDLDDTFCAAAALWQHDATLVTGEALARLAHVLMAAEVRPGGPYRTWLVAPAADGHWQDVDLAVNANVGYFLSLQGVTVPGVLALMEDRIRRARYASPYYPDALAPLYFISRWYRGKRVRPLKQQLLGRFAAAATNPLQLALILSSLARLGGEAVALRAGVELLLRMQQDDGSWPARAFCLDPAVDGAARYAGSPALTTALCIEALSLYQAAPQTAPRAASSDAHYEAVVQTAKQRLAELPRADLRAQTGLVLERVLHSGNERQIIGLPWLVAQATHAAVATATLTQLAGANLWGWAAYTIYDDFLDGEGQPALLPGATVCLRQLILTLAALLPGNDAFHEEVQRIMDRLDAANTWEICHCRGTLQDGRVYFSSLPEYGTYWQLADRSLGHTIAALGVLYAAGYGADAPVMRALREFFRHYLIARQLHDDARDWEEDLRHGHCNAAAVPAIRHWLVTQHRALEDGIDLAAEQEALQASMWEAAVVPVCAQITRQVRAARRALRTAGDAVDTAPLLALLDEPEQGAAQVLVKRQQVMDFITHWS
ncbi:MAG TPA: hypothetical protein VHC98_03830 [Candidatus Saccharimonadales bacterium]|nr:hypothetical protein [Candidatus Saccharimonadales bacterium]